MNQENPQDPTLQDVIEAINVFASNTERRFETIEVHMSKTEGRLNSIEADMGSMKSDMGSMKSDIISIKNQMVTKDYLDGKLGLLRGDILVLLRKEDSRLSTLIDILGTKKILDEKEIKTLQKLEPLMPIPS